MSQKMYDGILEKWLAYLSDNIESLLSSESISSEKATKMYDDISSDFCRENKYVERTQEMVFHGIWYDTFVDEFYKELDKHEIVIVVSKDQDEGNYEPDWDEERGKYR